MNASVAGLVLAGGRGSRFGVARPKHLAPIAVDGTARPLIAYALAPLRGLSSTYVVTGHFADEVEAALRGLDHPGLVALRLGVDRSRPAAVDVVLVHHSNADVVLTVEGDTVVDRRAIDRFVDQTTRTPPTPDVALHLLCCERPGRADRSTLVVDPDGFVKEVKRSSPAVRRVSVLSAALHRGALAGSIEALVERADAPGDAAWGMWQAVASSLCREGLRVRATVSEYGGVNVNVPSDLATAEQLLRATSRASLPLVRTGNDALGK